MRTPNWQLGKMWQIGAMAALLMAFLATPALAQNEGQADLDAATDKQLGAETLADLEAVVKLGESALKKGLDAGQEQFAKELLAATLFQKAERAAKSIFETQPPSPRWPVVRQYAVKDLDKAIGYNPKLPDAYLLKAKLLALPGGDEKGSVAALDEALKLLKDDPKQQAKALVLKGQLVDDREKKLEAFDAAAKADPDSVEAVQGRALLYLEKGDNDKAVEDLVKLLEKNADNVGVQAALSEALTNLKRYDEAIKSVDKLIALNPKSPLGYSLRARIRVLQNDLKGGVEDLDEAVKLNGRDLASLLMRGRLHAAMGNDELAKKDVDRALQLNPDLPQGILIRSMLAAQANRFADAIADIKMLLQADPKNLEYRLQLAMYYVNDKRPRQAIEMLNSILEDDEKNADALRARGDALLSVGKHKEAIEDYEKAIAIEPEDTGILNNLAWVLSTSTDDSVRNAKRSIELGQKACELTKYEKPHILSTLASGYAEAGDWENAVKWSEKAVAAAKEDVKEQLQKELESYKQKKPWREMQTVEENKAPLDPKKDDLET